jgi:hypothetical protein
MNCYWCETQPGPGGTRLRSITASAVCVECGGAVCREHSVRSTSDPKIRCVSCETPAVHQTRGRQGASR